MLEEDGRKEWGEQRRDAGEKVEMRGRGEGEGKVKRRGEGQRKHREGE